MVKNCLITGGCGFIGTSLIDQITKEDPDANIRILDNLAVGSRQDLGEACEFTEGTAEESIDQAGVFLVVGDIRDSAVCKKVSQGIECIVHLAANTGVAPSVEDPRADMEANIIGVFNMLEGARRNNVKKFIFASSGASIGAVEPPIHEEMAPHPVSPYGSSKLAGEGYCSSYYQTFGIKTVSLRFGNVYGPRSKRKSSVVAKFIRQALQGEVCEIYGDGTQTRDFIYIDELIKAIDSAIKFKGGGEVFQIASGIKLTLNELVKELKVIFENETGREMKIKNVEKRLCDVLRNYSDTSKAERVLGWKHNTSLSNGLQKTVRSFI
jgi:UDP-glucose 4-epimerase